MRTGTWVRVPVTRAARWGAVGTAGVVVALAIALIAVACTGDPGTPAALPEGDRPVRPVSLTGRALWDSRDLGLGKVAGAEFRGGTALVLGSGAGRGPDTRLAAADADTGRPRWMVDAGMPLVSRRTTRSGPVTDRAATGKPVLADGGYLARGQSGTDGKPLVVDGGNGDPGSGSKAAEGWSVLVRYVVEKAPGTESEHGVAALSGKDGSLRWKTKLPLGGELRLLSTEGDTALAAVADQQGGQVTSYALDTADGDVRWRHHGDIIHSLAGDTALGEHPGETGWWPGPGDSNRDGWVVALDADTGEKRWSLEHKYRESVLEGAVRGNAVVRTENSSSLSKALVLDTATGRGTHTLDEGFHTCARPVDGLLACAELSEPRLVTLRAGRRDEPVRSTREILDGGTLSGVRVGAVDGGRVYVSGTSDDTERDDEAERDRADGSLAADARRAAVVDRAGNTLREDLPGEPVAASARYAAFRVTVRHGSGARATSSEHVAVHRAADGARRPAGPGPEGPSEARPVSYDQQPLWSAAAGHGRLPETDTQSDARARETGLERLQSVDLVGDTLLYAGQTDDHGTRYVGVDANTGKVRWRIGGRGFGDGARPASQGLYQLAGAKRRTLLATYEREATGEQGVAAVSVRDGKVLWKQPVTYDKDEYVLLRDADAKRFVVRTSAYGAGSSDEGRTMVYDLAGHNRRAQVKNTGDDAFLAGGTLLTEVPARPGRAWADRTNSDVAAYDADSGKRKWRLRDRYDDAALLAVGGERAAVITHEGGGAVLDPVTGKRLATTRAPLHLCTGEADPLLVCRSGSGDTADGTHPVTVRTGGHAGSRTATLRELPALGNRSDYLTLGGRFFAGTGPAGPHSRGAFTTMDDHGRRPARSSLPGMPRAVTDDHVVLVNGQLGEGSLLGARITVHRRK
ncbi:PQQ-like beta-propeller repeat protein [Streptomyces sp. NBC_01775]|uniref:outer membrane protein assembly factor BamB family protein n=1 Tax=Streptomyces sp. NBC_01775 TaxID=2975939 RepID=UPI002DD84EA0|nr:PQQ-binding-like beta-propeller repeat protein [Streptomyces sp. NBC_01775]WSB78656.1 PQQ-like beta-propeller repeat protein [Streptomyces sp. NBC_01775]